MKFIRIILFSFFCLSCNEDYKKGKFIGDWSLIYPNSDSLYFEVKIDSSSITFYNPDFSTWPLKTDKFFVNGDSVKIIYSENKEKERNYYLKSLSDKKFVLKTNSIESEAWFFLIDTTEFTINKIRNLNQDKYKFEIAYLNRRNKALGINYFYNYDSLKIYEEMNKNVPEVEQLIVPNEITGYETQEEIDSIKKLIIK